MAEVSRLRSQVKKLEQERDSLVEALERIIEEFKAPAEPTGYEEDDPVVIIARAALAKVRDEDEFLPIGHPTC